MLYGFCPTLPGQMLNPTYHEESYQQLQDLLLIQQKRSAMPAVQPSAHNNTNKTLLNLSPETTHVYTKQHKALGLQPSFAGPFPLVEKLSRSTVKIKVGHKVNGEPIFEVRHLNDLKEASPDSHVSNASRAKKGRPTKKPDTTALASFLASIDFTKPPPTMSTKPWVATKQDIADLNNSISNSRKPFAFVEEDPGTDNNSS